MSHYEFLSWLHISLMKFVLPYFHYIMSCPAKIEFHSNSPTLIIVRSWESQPSIGYLKGSDRKCSALHILTSPVSDRFRIVFANTPRTLSVNQEGWSRVTLNDRRTSWARTRNSSMLSFEAEGWKLKTLRNTRVGSCWGSLLSFEMRFGSW